MTPTLVDLLEATSRLTYEEWSSLVVKITQKLRGVTPSGRDCEHDAARVMASLYQVAKDQQKEKAVEADELLTQALAALEGMRASPSLTEQAHAEAIIKKLNNYLAGREEHHG